MDIFTTWELTNLKINVRATSEQMIGSVGLGSLGAMANIIKKVIFLRFLFCMEYSCLLRGSQSQDKCDLRLAIQLSGKNITLV